MTRVRAFSAIVAIAVLVACSGSANTVVNTSPPVPPKNASPSPVPTGPGSAASARAALCDVPSTSAPPVPHVEGTPPQIAEVEHQVEEVRGLTYKVTIPVDAVTPAQMSADVTKNFDDSYPTDLYERRSKVWQTIGVIPLGTSILDDLRKFDSGQVAGYYVPENGELVYIGSDTALSALSHIILAHELTHALDDQYYHLERVDPLFEHCRDEATDAATAAIEGSAQYYSLQVATRFLSPQELIGAVGEIGDQPLPEGVAPFITQMELWPYEAGLAFITQIHDQGGNQAVDDVLQHFPTSTEQLMHPERYPNDRPTPLDVSNLGPKLGPAWKDFDVEDIGEEWLSIALGLRLDTSTASAAAAGWDGGIARSWSDGSRVATVMRTVWDTSEDATQFADAMRSWIDAGSGQTASIVPTDATHVDVLFASDASTLALLQTADQ